MSQYHAPLHDIEFLAASVFPLDAHLEDCGSSLDASLVRSVVLEAGKFAQSVLDPINRAGDLEGCRLQDGAVRVPDAFQHAYRAFCEGGWNGLRQPEEYGGQGLSYVLSTLTEEIWHACNPSFALCAMLTSGAIETLLSAADPALKAQLLPRLISGEWTGTMNLTEPAAGSDLAAVKTRAIPKADGSYAISGQKIFITYGDHDLAANIIHLVLARHPDAPAGAKGLSLFAVPKYLVNSDGTLGARNDVHCTALEHKLGIHASPTAVMQFGADAGAIGYLVGERNEGLKTMFIMMNEARFSVGNQGLAISERAYQHAVWYARERVQGRIVGEEERGGTILRHPDVRRMLLAMKSRIQAMRALGMYISMRRDEAHAAGQPETRRQARERVELLIPVMKGWFTENAQRITYDAVQVFGGMGFIEETGAAQYYRDARIAPIYEGTNGIQAMDLVGRKLSMDGGESAKALIAEMKATLAQIDRLYTGKPVERFATAIEAVEDATLWLLDAKSDPARAADVLAGADAYLKLMGDVVGGWMLAKGALAAKAKLDANDGDAVWLQGKLDLYEVYAANVLGHVSSRLAAVGQGGDLLQRMSAEALAG